VRGLLSRGSATAHTSGAAFPLPWPASQDHAPSETHTAGAALVTVKANRLVALTIAPVEAQHIAILNYVLGQYPVPYSFIQSDMAASPEDLSES
jgi:hypothetical protein